MGKVFRLYAGNNNLQDWDTSVVYGSNAIGQIQDPNGASAKKQITSIPSPFARIDLVKTAYREVVNSGNVNGQSIYHKMVSDSLDVAQLFFNSPQMPDKLEIIRWDRNAELDLLKENGSAQQRVGETLDMFLKQDAATYNFNYMDELYLLRYKGNSRKTMCDIIGATSPATLFFCSANDLSYTSNDLSFGADEPFDAVYASLGNRAPNFIQFYYALRCSIQNFPQLFPEVNDYLNLVYRDLAIELKNEIDNLNANSINNYSPLPAGANVVSIIRGINYYSAPLKDYIKSDFEIRPGKAQPSQKLPLILPIEAGTKYCQWLYVTTKWQSSDKAPAVDGRKLEERCLPGTNEKYPYLTISDFLEDKLVRVEVGDFESHNLRHFFPAVSEDQRYAYLLPLKPLFFKYFTTQDLLTGHNGSPMLDFKSGINNTIRVSLYIPMACGAFMEYQRNYTAGLQSDCERNKGELCDREFSVGLLPAFRYPNREDNNYRVSIVCDFNERQQYSMSFYEGESSIEPTACVERNIDKEDQCVASKTYVIEKKCFDFISINGRNAGGILLPLFQAGENTPEQVTFAVDFGTTNTHVEYSVNNGNAAPLELSAPIVSLWGALHNKHRYMLEYDILPQQIGRDCLCRYPMRTALNVGNQVNWNRSQFAMADTNLPFLYEKRDVPAYNKVQTDLKWNEDTHNTLHVKQYIENLYFLFRLKVIQCKGDLRRTKILWFYPASMSANRYERFRKAWTDAYEKYFGPVQADSVMAMTESVAPFKYFRAINPEVNDIVTIDIGGGTTDMVIAKQKEVKRITSFRFAADAIFGDGYTERPGKNTFNKMLMGFSKKAQEIFDSNKLGDYSQVFTGLDKDGVSKDLASFLFSLRDNNDLKGRGLADKLDFNEFLSDREKDYKVIFVIFYAAIMYHLAHIMKALGEEMPRHIAFSGNGSKVIRILAYSNETLEGFTKVIFEKVYGRPYPSDGLTILQNRQNPKEATCKGGLCEQQGQEYSVMQPAKVVYNGISGKEPFVINDTYGTIDEEYKKGIINEVTRFIDFTLSLNAKFPFKSNFGVTERSLKIVRDKYSRDLKTYLSRGLEQKMKDVSEDDRIDESLFFFPLVGMVRALINEIGTDNKTE